LLVGEGGENRWWDAHHLETETETLSQRINLFSPCGGAGRSSGIKARNSDRTRGRYWRSVERRTASQNPFFASVVHVREPDRALTMSGRPFALKFQPIADTASHCGLFVVSALSASLITLFTVSPTATKWKEGSVEAKRSGIPSHQKFNFAVFSPYFAIYGTSSSGYAFGPSGCLPCPSAEYEVYSSCFIHALLTFTSEIIVFLFVGAVAPSAHPRDWRLHRSILSRPIIKTNTNVQRADLQHCRVSETCNIDSAFSLNSRCPPYLTLAPSAICPPNQPQIRFTPSY
jgi:hypothetical protein